MSEGPYLTGWSILVTTDKDLYWEHDCGFACTTMVTESDVGSGCIVAWDIDDVLDHVC